MMREKRVGVYYKRAIARRTILRIVIQLEIGRKGYDDDQSNRPPS